MVFAETKAESRVLSQILVFKIQNVADSYTVNTLIPIRKNI